MPFPWLWNPTSPSATADKVSDFPTMTFYHGDKTTLKDILPLTDLSTGATLGWRVRQVGNSVWMTYNAAYSGGSWVTDDPNVIPVAIRFNSDGTANVLYGSKASTTTWTVLWTWAAPTGTGTLGGVGVDAIWNDAARTFEALKVAVTDTASAVGSFLLRLLVGGAEKFSVIKTGVVNAYNTLKVMLGTITSDVRAVDISATWNNASVDFHTLSVDVTDTASGSGSTLIDASVGGTTKFAVFASGQVRGGGVDPSHADDLVRKSYVDSRTLTVTQKRGSGAGNYSTTSASYVYVDSTNLSYSVNVPSGQKLQIWVSGTVEATGVSAGAVAIGKDGTPIHEVWVHGSAAQTPFSLLQVVDGDGSSHTYRLMMKTSSSYIEIRNQSSTDTPIMMFTHP